MTNNEAIIRIKFLLDFGGNGFTSSYEEALNMAINALFEKTTAPPKSNGDRIRQMTDEELAEFMCLVTDKLCFGCSFLHVDECEGISCKEARMQWLRKEVDEDVGTD